MRMAWYSSRVANKGESTPTSVWMANSAASQGFLVVMHTTPVSLLLRLQQRTDQAAWGQFVRLYTPLFFHWAHRLGFEKDEAADLVQEVLMILVRQMPKFQ